MTMTQRSEFGKLTRRQALKGVTALGVVSAAAFALAPDARADQKMLDAAIKKVTGGKKAAEGKITLDLPQIAENGNTVPVGVKVASPMTKDDHVKTVYLFAEGNPAPEVATFHFTPMNGAAEASTRMRLAKTQNVVAIAEMSNGSVYRASKTVKVTIGGCGG